MTACCLLSFAPIFFFLTMQDNFDDLWMDQHQFYECTSNLKYNVIQALSLMEEHWDSYHIT